MSLSPKYLAGIIDGETTLGLYRRKTQIKGKTYSWIQASIEITQKSKPYLEILKEEFGGQINSNHSGCWRLTFSSHSEVARILKLVLPYLILKRKKAKILLSFVKLRLNAKKKRYSNNEWNLLVKYQNIEDVLES